MKKLSKLSFSFLAISAITHPLLAQSNNRLKATNQVTGYRLKDRLEAIGYRLEGTETILPGNITANYELPTTNCNNQDDDLDCYMMMDPSTAEAVTEAVEKFSGTVFRDNHSVTPSVECMKGLSNNQSVSDGAVTFKTSNTLDRNLQACSSINSNYQVGAAIWATVSQAMQEFIDHPSDAKMLAVQKMMSSYVRASTNIYISAYDFVPLYGYVYATAASYASASVFAYAALTSASAVEAEGAAEAAEAAKQSVEKFLTASTAKGWWNTFYKVQDNMDLFVVATRKTTEFAHAVAAFKATQETLTGISVTEGENSSGITGIKALPDRFYGIAIENREENTSSEEQVNISNWIEHLKRERDLIDRSKPTLGQINKIIALIRNNRHLSKLAYADEVQGVDGAEKLSVQELLDASSTDATKQFAAEVEYQVVGRPRDRLRRAELEQPEGRAERERASQFGKKSNDVGSKMLQSMQDCIDHPSVARMLAAQEAIFTYVYPAVSAATSAYTSLVTCYPFCSNKPLAYISTFASAFASASAYASIAASTSTSVTEAEEAAEAAEQIAVASAAVATSVKYTETMQEDINWFVSATRKAAEFARAAAILRAVIN